MDVLGQSGHQIAEHGFDRGSLGSHVQFQTLAHQVGPLTPHKHTDLLHGVQID